MPCNNLLNRSVNAEKAGSLEKSCMAIDVSRPKGRNANASVAVGLE